MNIPRYETAREKSKRPQLSCNSCRARKVKCDRLQPCSACSLHQISEQCQYDLTESERKPILQAEALRAKDREIAWLKEQIEHLGGSPVNSDLSHDRKKRKTVLSTGHRGTRSPSQRPSPTHNQRHQDPTRYAPVPQQSGVNRSCKRSKPSVKYISIPSPDDAGVIATRGPDASPPQHWGEVELSASWPPELERALSQSSCHAYGNAKLTTPDMATAIKDEHPSCMSTGTCGNGETIVLAHHPRLWGPCFSSGSESLSAMPTCSSPANAADFISYSTASSHGIPSATATVTTPASTSVAATPHANCRYSTPSLPTPSSASYPSSTYAHSASGSSSLHTPSESHPVSPSLSQNQPFGIGQPQTQPPSPIWAFDNQGGPAGTVHHGYMSGPDSANTAALIAELAGSGEKESVMPTWQWKMAWAS